MSIKHYIRFFLYTNAQSLKKYRFVFLILFFIYASVYFYIAKNALRDNKIPSDVIIVLGAKSNRKDTYNLCLVERVNHGTQLLKKGYAKKIIFSGGNDTVDSNQAENMKQIAVLSGVNPQSILLEKDSINTYQNLVYTKSIMEKQKLYTAIIVTDPYHTPRASLLAGKLQLRHTVSPALKSPCWTNYTYFSPHILKEPFAIIYYFLSGKI